MSASYDIAVIGAGAAGVMAGHVAASRGASVVLIEASDRLGGAVTAAMHRSLCGLYAREPANPADTLNDGPQRRFIERLAATAPSQVQPRQFGKAWVLEFPSAAYEATLTGLADVRGVQRLMRTRVTQVRRSGDHIAAVCADDAWIDVGAVIDCTGGGRLLQLVGEDAMLPADSEPMLGGYALRISGLAGDLESLRLFAPYALSRAVEQGNLPAIARFAVFYPGPGAGEGVLKLAIDKHDPLTNAGELADAVFSCLRREVGGFDDAQLIERSPRIIPRDGRRLRGRSILTEDDVLGARRYGSDAIRGWWPIERWDAAQGPTYRFPPEGEPYEIPADVLHSASVGNLFAAGSCISATADAAASARVSGICLATGALAGELAR